MKTYRIVGTNGKTYTLAGIVDSVKEAIEDTVQARERVRLHRQLKKGLIDPAVFAIEQQTIASITMQTSPCLIFIASKEGHRVLFREMLIAGGLPEPTDADVDAVYDAQAVEGSEAWAVSRAIWEDAYPKAPTGTVKTKAGPRSRRSTAAATTGSPNSPTKTEAEIPVSTPV